ncbi:MAG TPA: acyl-CoA dehydrogenase family protein [Mycobacteriales bacterium]|nr:acyl-CoA dehydrogenase family protein [Mycobacteriales bacterium]
MDRLVADARRLADDVLWPQAARADREGVRREVVDVLAGAGLLGLDAPAPTVRAVQEALAGGCGATSFVVAQHRFPLLSIRDSANTALRDRWLPVLRSGQTLAAVAFSHLRRVGAPAVTATRAPGGWRLDGTVAWTTSWGLADVLLVAGVDPSSDRVVFALIPARPQNGLTARRLDLAVLGGTGTVALHLEGLAVADVEVVHIQNHAAWRDKDAGTTSNATPASFGLLWRICRQLAERDPRLAEELRLRGEALRESAYLLIDQTPPSDELPERIHIRAKMLVLLQRAAAAYVTVSGGRGMDLEHPAQRLAREAQFALVQAQTPPVRSATLAELGT